MAVGVQPELDERTIRAVTEYMSVLEVGHALFEVVSQSGATYTVDLVEPACTCPDFTYRNDNAECKHIRATRLSVGQVNIPDLAAEFDARAAELDAHASQLSAQAQECTANARRLRTARTRLLEDERC